MEELANAIGEAHAITIVAHLNPDGDAVGSVLGLYWALRGLGKQITPVLHDTVPEVFARILPGADLIQAEWPETADLCILLDASSGNRTGFPEQIEALAKQGRVAVVDHHPKAELAKTARAYIHDLEASSTSELLLYIIQNLSIKINADIATCLLTGLYTDTGGFKHANTTEHALEAGAELMRRGGNLQKITNSFEQDKSLAGLRLLGLALERANGHYHDRCTITCLNRADFERLETGDEELPGIISQINNLPGSRFALLLSEAEPGTIRGNLRSANEYNFNVSKLAQLLGGGGHAKASGFKIRGRLTEQNGRWIVE